MEFQLKSEYKPTGDQPQAIEKLSKALNSGEKHQTLLGVTGSGKTFTVANVIAKQGKPTLVLSHNKTLAAQLYSEFKTFFPNNKVEYYVSYYDYYQPEAYLPVSDTYIEKDLAINDEIEKLRLSTTSSLLSGRSDVIVVASVSCIYGIGNPETFHKNVIGLKRHQTIGRDAFLHLLVDNLYARSSMDFQRGSFRVKGDTVDVFLAYDDIAYRVVFWDDEIEEIYSIDPLNGSVIEEHDQVMIYPANLFVTERNSLHKTIYNIQDDLVKQIEFFKSIDKHIEAKRIEDRVTFDLEMIREIGHCSGIENYSRYFDGREAGTRPFCLLDYFPDDYLLIVDESHVTIPQIRAMYGGDRSRKQNLVDFGFRLPSALDNRPLKFDEFESLTNQIIYISATPADYELEKSGGVVVEQLIRPTGLIDPEIIVKPSLNLIDDLLEEIRIRVGKEERVLVTTLTKRMAEELDKYLAKASIRSRYIHSDVDTLERVEIMEDLRAGRFDVLVGVNLLREGLDLPEVSLVAILDADKEGFLRSTRSLTQTAGRAARNVNGKVIMYADKITRSMQALIDDTERKRTIQLAYNEKYNITPTQIVKAQKSILGYDSKAKKNQTYQQNQKNDLAADPVIKYMGKSALEKAILQTESLMKKAAIDLDFIEAARLRDELKVLKSRLDEEKNKGLQN
ncbi:MAG: excinuclease ABC subunit UvrB [Bacteroidales bacterium]|nr:excinuclease ABC subunit UvrB [Bacteroidales bacterium]